MVLQERTTDRPASRAFTLTSPNRVGSPTPRPLRVAHVRCRRSNAPSFSCTTAPAPERSARSSTPLT